MIYLFDGKQQLVDELRSSALVSAVQEETLNSVMKFTFEIYNTYHDRMDNIEYVAHKDMENQSQIQMYKIITSTVGEKSTTYDCIHVIFDDLSAYGYLKNVRLDKVKASGALDHVLKDTKWEQGLTSDSVLKSINFYDIDKLTGLYDIIKTWGMELQFSIGFDGNQITSRKVWLENQVGTFTGERFVYGDKALEVVEEIDKANICTRIIPRGKKITDTEAYKNVVEAEQQLENAQLEAEREEQRKLREIQSEINQLKGIREATPYETSQRTTRPRRVEDEDAYVEKVEITNISWAPTEEVPISKPKGQEYLELEEMTMAVGFPDGTPRVKVVEFSDIEDSEELLKASYEKLVEMCRPLVEYKTKVNKKSMTHIGDRVVVIRRELDIFYTTRIFKIKRDLLAGSYELEFGDSLTGSYEKPKYQITLEDLKKENEFQKDFIRDIQDQLHEQMFNQDGYNYELGAENEYALPGGYYSFDRAIDDNPTKVIYVGGGMMAIANSKKDDNTWDWRSFGTGDGFVADLIVAGMLRGGKVRWNLEDGTFIIGDSVDEYSMYWDGATLHLRDVDIDLENNDTIQGIKQQFVIAEGNVASAIQSVREDTIELNNTTLQTISENYSTIVQTDKKIESVVSQTNEILKGYSTISQTSDAINLEVKSLQSDIDDKVDTNGIISAINLSPERIQIDSDKLDIDVSKLDLKVDEITTTWSRYNTNTAIHIKNSTIDLYNNSGAKAGGLTTGYYTHTGKNIISLGHDSYEGTLVIDYGNYPYMTFDEWGIQHRHPITVHTDIEFLGDIYGYIDFKNGISSDGTILCDGGFATSGESAFNGKTTFRDNIEIKYSTVTMNSSDIIFNNDMRIARQYNGISIQNASGDGFLFANNGHMYRYEGGSKGTTLF